MSLQPNFEIVKTAFYQAFVDNSVVDNILLMESINGKLLSSFAKRKVAFKKSFNEWLDSLDIRCVVHLIQILKREGKKLPSWIENDQYYIDYNKHEVLDLIKS